MGPALKGPARAVASSRAPWLIRDRGWPGALGGKGVRRRGLGKEVRGGGRGDGGKGKGKGEEKEKLVGRGGKGETGEGERRREGVGGF